jgi:hypothetical protein
MVAGMGFSSYNTVAFEPDKDSKSYYAENAALVWVIVPIYYDIPRQSSKSNGMFWAAGILNIYQC